MFKLLQKKDKEPVSYKVISVLNQKGGVGKTTLSFNLARTLKERGHRVLAIDMDPQGNLSLLSGGKKEAGVFQLLLNSIRELKPLHRSLEVKDLIHTESGVDYLMTEAELSGFELTVAGISSPRQLILKNFLMKNDFFRQYDYIVIDSPPTLGLLMVNILCASQGILIPFQPDQFSGHGLGLLQDTLEQVEEMEIVEVPKVLGFVPNLVEARRKQTYSDFEKIQKRVGGQAPIFSAIPNRVQIVKASAQKKTVFDFNSKEYAELKDCFHNIGEQIERSLT